MNIYFSVKEMKGFTLIELMIVIAIICIMAAVIIPSLDFEDKGINDETINQIDRGCK